MQTTVRDLLIGGTSINQAERYLHTGIISQNTFEAFCLFADWCAPRFSDVAGYKQERFWNQFGRDAYYRRIDRVKHLHDRIIDGTAKIAAR